MFSRITFIANTIHSTPANHYFLIKREKNSLLQVNISLFPFLSWLHSTPAWEKLIRRFSGAMWIMLQCWKREKTENLSSTFTEKLNLRVNHKLRNYWGGKTERRHKICDFCFQNFFMKKHYFMYLCNFIDFQWKEEIMWWRFVMLKP